MEEQNVELYKLKVILILASNKYRLHKTGNYVANKFILKNTQSKLQMH